jgi:hypothetical protein
MRLLLAAAALAALSAPAVTASAQPRDPPPGSYQRACTNIYMEGQYLHATCRGPRGGGQSTLNVLSCATDIGVDATGGLTCLGPEAVARARERGYAAPPPPPGYRGPAYRARESVTIYAGRNLRGRSMRIDGEAPNLDRTGLNDRVRSIRLGRRSGPWLVCTDADYRGRCTTIRSSVTDTRRIGMAEGISSLRPVY